MGEEVRDPARTIPRAIPLALGITVAVYALVAVAVLATLGAEAVAATPAPLAAAVEASTWTWAAPVVRIGAAHQDLSPRARTRPSRGSLGRHA